MNRIFDYRRTVSKKELEKKIHVVSYGSIRSSEDRKVVYLMARYNNNKCFCSCPDFIFRQPSRCKHLKQFIRYEKLRKP